MAAEKLSTCLGQYSFHTGDMIGDAHTLVMETLCGSERMLHHSQLHMSVNIQRNGNASIGRESNVKTWMHVSSSHDSESKIDQFLAYLMFRVGTGTRPEPDMSL